MSDICKSCGEHFTNHLGLEGTCRLLQERTKERDKLRGQLKEAEENKVYGWETARESQKAYEAEYGTRKHIQEHYEKMKAELEALRARVAWLDGGLRAVQKHQVATGGEMAKHGSIYLICEKALNPEKS